MSISEGLQTMEALWDSLTYEKIEIESPEWHGDILAERQKKIEIGEATYISLDESRVNTPPILSRLGINEKDWIGHIHYFERQFPTVAGNVEKLKRLAEQTSRRWIKGVGCAFQEKTDISCS